MGGQPVSAPTNYKLIKKKRVKPALQCREAVTWITAPRRGA